MTTQRTIDDIERDIQDIFGDDSETSINVTPNLATIFHNTELSQIEALLEADDDDYMVASDEEFYDVGNDAEDGEEDAIYQDSSSDEDSEDSSAADDNVADEWTLHRPRNAADVCFTGQDEFCIPEETTTPFEFFKLIFTIEILTNIVTATNECAHMLLAQSRFAKSRINDWKDLRVEELLTFLGILFHMGTIKVNRYTDYWRKHYLFNLFTSRFMGRKRFMLIFKCIRFGRINLDSLITFFNKKMAELYSPGENLCIDESIILSRGRSGIRQYMPGKRHKYGIKLYILATPGGLSLQTHMYRGRRADEVGGIGHTDKVVNKLMQNYMNTGRHVYMDNFYNSVGLAKFLLRKETNVTGTLRSSRKGNSKVVCSTKLRKGGSIFRYDKDAICLCKWCDKRDVLLISTKHSPELKPVINRRGQTILKPELVVEYNKYMKGVDRQNQMLAYYTCEHKCMRWYKKVGIHVLQMMMLNAYYLNNMKKNSKMSLYDFREGVITALLPPPITAQNNRGTNNNVHVPEYLPKNDRGHTKRKRCKYCWDSKKTRKNTVFLSFVPQ